MEILNYVWNLAIILTSSGFLTTLTSAIITSSASLIAGFGGAWIGFKFQSRHKHMEEDRENIAAGNRALMGLMRRANFMRQFTIEHIDPLRGNPGRHIAIRPTLNKPPNYCEINDSELKFLSTEKEQNIVFELWLEGERFAQVIEVMNRRNDLHLNELQPAMRAHGSRHKENVSQADIRAAFGEAREAELSDITNSLIEILDAAVASNQAMSERLLATLSSRFPDGKFISFTTK